MARVSPILSGGRGGAMSTVDHYDHMPVQAGRELKLIHRVARIAAQSLAFRVKLRQVVDALKHHLGCEFVACASIDARLGRFVCEALSTDLPTKLHVGYGRALGGGVVGEVAANGISCCISDVTQHADYIETLPSACSELCVAVRHNGEVIAVIIAECSRPGVFDRDIELVETIAAQVAGIFAAARLNDEQRRHTLLLTMLSDLSRLAIEASGDLDQILRRIVQFLRGRFALENCAILLLDAAQQQLTLHAHAGKSTFGRRLGEAWPATSGIIGRALRAGEVQFVADVTLDSDYVIGNPSVRTELVLPICFQGSLLGLLNLESADAETFSEFNRQMLSALGERVAGAIHLASTNERLREANAQLERLSHLDGLTGIANRRRFDEALITEWQRAGRHGHSLSLLLIDIDDFKAYNDGYGHLAGDDALRRVAVALAGVLHRGENVLARFGGEEFAVLLPETDVADAERCAWHLHAVISGLGLPHRYARVAKRLSISIGIASLDAGVRDTPERLVDRADRALYRAKALGRDRVESVAGLSPIASSA